jgi:voltage-gated potassium channel Kch
LEAPEIDDAAHRVIVIGYGPVGRTLSRILRDNGIQVVVVETNLQTVQQLLSEGEAAVYADASEREILHHAGIEKADGLIIAASGVSADAVVKAARELNPKIRILTRATYLGETGKLRESGANAVFSSEGEIALSMTEFVMRQMGATDEQINRSGTVFVRTFFRPNLSAKCSGDAPPAVATRERCGRVPNRRPRGHGRHNGVRRAQRSVWRVEQRSWKFDSSCQRDPPTPICLLPKTAHRSFAHAA